MTITNNFPPPFNDDYNGWANFWRHKIGVNVIPADTQKKVTYESWSEWQDKPIPQELHNDWKIQNAFSKGMAIIVGNVWHREDKKDQYLVFVDVDNVRAIEEFCTRDGKTTTLQEVAQKFLVEQHKDNTGKAHIYFYSPKPFVGKGSDIRPTAFAGATAAELTNNILSGQIPAFEIKSIGKHGIAFCTPSIHKDGCRYEIIGTLDPIALNEKQASELQQHLYNICKKYGIGYAYAQTNEVSGNGNGKSLTPIHELFKPETRIYQGHNRHEALLRVMESLIWRNRSILQLEKIKQLASDWNSEHCDPPLEDSEFEKQWKCAANFVATTNAIKKVDYGSGGINWKNINTDGNVLGSSSFNTTYGKRAATITDISSSNSTTVTKKREHTAYKYSNNGKSDLHEAVIVAGLPVFVKYDVDDNKVKAVEQLEESSRIIKPPNIEEYPYEPYEFANIKEVETYIDRAKGETVDSLYQKIKSISQKYNDQDEHKIVLLAADIVWSFFQDKFSTTHYVAVIGDNGSGKSTYGDTFGAIGYRAINMTDPTSANIFRVLGTIEPGQCTIIADEAEKIDQSLEIMSTLKTGYHIKSKVSRVNMNNGKQDFFWTFCFKMMIAERSPDISKAKGVMDRTFKIKTYKGRPQSDIKEVLKPSGNPRLQSLLDEIIDLRKLMLVYRLIHFKDAVVDIDIGLEGRNKELCKPLLQLFYNTNSQNEVKSSLQKFVDSKNQTKGHTMEAVLYPIMVNLISKNGNRVYACQLWYEIIHNIDGKYDDKKPNEYHTIDYNILYRNTITNIICDKFGASREHKKDGTVLVFDVEKLLKIGSLYDLNDNIQVKEITGMEDSGEMKGEGCESSEGSIVCPCTAIQLYEPIPDSKIDVFRNYHP